MWFQPALLGAAFQGYLSTQYTRDWAGKRQPVVVILPDGTAFCPDGKHDGQDHEGMMDGPTVKGDPPELTVLGKIRVSENYSGTLTKGEFSEDEEGRTYAHRMVKLSHYHEPVRQMAVVAPRGKAKAKSEA